MSKRQKADKIDVSSVAAFATSSAKTRSKSSELVAESTEPVKGWTRLYPMTRTDTTAKKITAQVKKLERCHAEVPIDD